MGLISVASTLAILVLVQLPQAAQGRWEELPLVGLLCFPFMEPWFCVRDREEYFTEKECGDDPNAPDLQLRFLADFYYETGNERKSGGLYNKGWLQTCDYCSWSGITCEGAQITGIDVCEFILSASRGVIDI